MVWMNDLFFLRCTGKCSLIDAGTGCSLWSMNILSRFFVKQHPPIPTLSSEEMGDSIIKMCAGHA